MDTYGTHGLSCRYSGGHLPCHASVNETIRLALVSNRSALVSNRSALVSNRKTKETVTMHIFYFTTLMNFKSLKNVV